MATLTSRTLATGLTLSDLIHIVITGDTSQSANGSSYKATLSQFVPLFTGTTNTFVTGGTYNNATGTATFTNNSGSTFTVSGFTTGTTSVFTTGGTYNNTTGTATFTNSTGGTFTVSGFTTGATSGTEVFVRSSAGTRPAAAFALALPFFRCSYIKGCSVIWLPVSVL